MPNTGRVLDTRLLAQVINDAFAVDPLVCSANLRQLTRPAQLMLFAKRCSVLLSLPFLFPRLLLNSFSIPRVPCIVGLATVRIITVGVGVMPVR